MTKGTLAAKFIRWFRNIDDHEILLKELVFDHKGKPVNGVVEITRCGETHSFKIVNGEIAKG